MKDYKVKVRIPCEVFGSLLGLFFFYYVTARTKAEARRRKP